MLRDSEQAAKPHAPKVYKKPSSSLRAPASEGGSSSSSSRVKQQQARPTAPLPPSVPHFRDLALKQEKAEKAALDAEASPFAAFAQQQQQQREKHQQQRQVPRDSACSRSPKPEHLLFSPEAREEMEETLRPYYQRCIELLLSDLVQCLYTFSYKQAAFQERQAAIEKCMSLVSSPTLSLSALQTFVNYFGGCIKTKASPAELDIHLQRELVEDVLHLSQILKNAPAGTPQPEADEFSKGRRRVADSQISSCNF